MTTIVPFMPVSASALPGLQRARLDPAVDRLFERFARLLVLRIDLAYTKDLNISPEELEKELARFHANMRHNTLFEGMVGYMEKIENGAEKGAHAHLLFFFDGSKREGDYTLAEAIGEYWSNHITKGRGMYWNCNIAKNKRDLQRKGRLGIGEIHVTNINKINNLKYIVGYFCKSEQFIKPITKRKMKLLRRGLCPKQIGPKRGAPRRTSQVLAKIFPVMPRSPALANFIDNPASPPPLPYWALPHFPQMML